ncbi:MAG: peptide chain release factor N(5)-glutamine methyltransferase [Planctomycetes bacterium]|nr:peptide chain release factor N(5)-glutamine methyltransferase [Planctomycetota bacterium]
MTQPEEPWTIGRLLTWTIDYLGKHGAENPRLDAEVLLAEARGCRRIDLYAAYGETADEKTRTAFRELVRRRAAGTPVAYLVGRREFYSLEFEVTPDVLIPRPETEHVVIALLDHVKQRPTSDTSLEIADVGTGSGVLAVCAAKYVPTSRVTAIDISPAALAVARRNAARHGVAERIEFIESNLFASVPANRQFDYIVSNPPYVSTAEMAQLAVDVRNHEPKIALHAGDRGTDVIAPLIEQATTRLRSGGALLIEVSPMIAPEVEQVIRSTSGLKLEPTVRDLAGHARVVQATK